MTDGLTRKQWEAICQKCGKCCYEKIDLGGGIVKYTDQPCEHLDTETNLCKVYEERHEREPDCLELTERLIRTVNWMPKKCAYVAYFRRLDTLRAVRAAARRGKTPRFRSKGERNGRKNHRR